MVASEVEALGVTSIARLVENRDAPAKSCRYIFFCFELDSALRGNERSVRLLSVLRIKTGKSRSEKTTMGGPAGLNKPN